MLRLGLLSGCDASVLARREAEGEKKQNLANQSALAMYVYREKPHLEIEDDAPMPSNRGKAND
jgi:hypothetical protein